MVLIYCITGTLKFDKFLLKLDRLLLSSQQGPVCEPCQTTSAGCLQRSRSGPSCVWCWSCPSDWKLVHNKHICQPVLSSLMCKCHCFKQDFFCKCQATGENLWGHLLWMDVQLNEQRFVFNSLTNRCESPKSMGRPCFTFDLQQYRASAPEIADWSR